MADKLTDTENVIRYLKRRFYCPELKQWSTDIFELRQGETAISVCREQLLESVAQGVMMSFPESMHKSIIAYTTLNVGDVRNLSNSELTVDVIPAPSESNPAHAGIEASISDTPIIGIPTSPAYYNLQGKLLALALSKIEPLP